MSDPTPPLDDFLVAYENDANVWWRLQCGDHQNLFEDAVGRMIIAQTELRDLGDSIETLLNLCDRMQSHGVPTMEIREIREMLKP